MDMSIIVCTLRRPRHLEEALRACFALRDLSSHDVEIVIVDNSPEASARESVSILAVDAPVHIRYVHEPRTSIANARNAGVSASSGRLIAFIDDDMRPSPDWLNGVFEIMDSKNADVLIGAVEPVFEPCQQQRDGRLLDTFRRDFRSPDGASIQVRRSGYISGVGTGNSVLRRATCITSAEPFDPMFGQSGGEDTEFFLRLGQRRLKIVWSGRSLAYEIVASDRATMSYLVQRTYRGSQNYARAMIKNSRRRRLTRISLALVGGGQGLVRAMRYGVLRLIRSERADGARLATAAALGKIPWSSAYRPWWEFPR
jgi:succinoglycan biosynthesis protein ExoM